MGTYLLTYNVAMDTVVNKWKSLIGGVILDSSKFEFG